MRKPRKEFSKTILRAVAAATVVIVVFSFALMWRTGDTSPLAYIIPGIFTELSAATGFYFWKAKAENEDGFLAGRAYGEYRNSMETEGFAAGKSGNKFRIALLFQVHQFLLSDTGSFVEWEIPAVGYFLAGGNIVLHFPVFKLYHRCLPS